MSDLPDSDEFTNSDEVEYSSDEIEQAYLRALEAVDDLWTLGESQTEPLDRNTDINVVDPISSISGTHDRANAESVDVTERDAMGSTWSGIVPPDESDPPSSNGVQEISNPEPSERTEEFDHQFIVSSPEVSDPLEIPLRDPSETTPEPAVPSHVTRIDETAEHAVDQTPVDEPSPDSRNEGLPEPRLRGVGAHRIDWGDPLPTNRDNPHRGFADAGKSTTDPSNSKSPTPDDAAQKPNSATKTDSQSTEPTVNPAQVIEAALFVGGQPLSAGKLYAVLRGTVSVEQVSVIIDELNSLYQAQQRPYEIRLGDGGYRLELRPEYDRLKARVFGQGPREVKLSQDALEVLAVVAYRQPITQAELEQLGKASAGNTLRQLIRRDLIQIERNPSAPKEVAYRTTQRFLSAFGIGSLAELPQPDDLAAR